MAGGMNNKPRPGLTLAERSRLTGIGTAGQAPRRHCWVTGPDEDPGPFPGLILHWHRERDEWLAWVVYLVGDDLDTAVQAWVPRARLQPTG